MGCDGPSRGWSSGWFTFASWHEQAGPSHCVLCFCVCVCSVCVCVCPPLEKGFSTNFGRSTEHSLANSVQRSYALEWEARIDHPCVPARTFYKLSNPHGLIHGGSTILPPNLSPPQTCSRFPAEQRRQIILQTCTCGNNFKQYCLSRLMRLAVPSPFSQRGN